MATNYPDVIPMIVVITSSSYATIQLSRSNAMKSCDACACPLVFDPNTRFGILKAPA
jgi:hypothetical protein